MQYQLSIPVPESRFIYIKTTKQNKNEGAIELQLSSWRPGRYEIGNFAKNVRNFKVADSSGKELLAYKVSRDKWKIDNAPVGDIVISYEYYAAQPDAGACWLDSEFLYVNPVHCILFDPSNIQEEYSVHLDIPSSWEIACALNQQEKNVLVAKSYDELADSPFFASTSLQHETYEVSNHKFHIWFQGDCNPDWKKIKDDFSAFSKVQLEMMKKLPTKEYHFLILILPYRFYHGVEHVSSTVLALGPGYKLMDEELYSNLLGVASHELFHAWNVKTLRPADFLDYDFTKENYSRLGWVYEGFTTYYGDLFLARSKYFNVKSFFTEINSRLQRHFDNYGRYNLSVADSSYDTWLDGYVPGVPHRKTSIYDEGCLIALMLDLLIRRETQDKKSLDDLFFQLYNDFAKDHHGYRENDLRLLAESFAGDKVNVIFDKLINKAANYEEQLQELLNHVGCYLQKKDSRNEHEKLFGFKTINEGGVLKVYTVIPNSPAEIAGLAKDDEIIACNSWKVENNLSDLIKSANDNFELIVVTQKKIRTISLKKTDKAYFETVSLALINDANDDQKKAFEKWTGLNFPSN